MVVDLYNSNNDERRTTPVFIIQVYKSKSKPEFDTEVPRLVLSFMVEGNYFINKLTVYSLTDEKWGLGADRPTQIIF